MKRMLFVILASLLLAPSAHVRAEAAQGRAAALQDQSNSAPPSVAELEEAARLTATVVRLYGEGKYEEALKPARRALEIRERLLGPEHELVNNAVGNLASVYMGLKNFKEAEPLYQRLLPVYEKKFGAESAKVAQVLDLLALLRYARGDNNKAEEYYQRSLSMREKIFGPESREAAQSLYNLAEFYQLTERLQKAEPLYRHAVAIREKLYGPLDSNTIDVMDRYSCLLRKAGKEKEAAEVEARESGVLAPAPGPNGKSSMAPLEGGVINGRALSLPKPPYPPEAISRGVSGLVAVRITINEEGRVIRACAMSGPAPLWRVSESAAMRAQFSPTKLSGQPVQVTGVVTYRFLH